MPGGILRSNENPGNAQAYYGMFWRSAKRTAREGLRWVRRKAEGDERDQLPLSAFLVSACVRLSPAPPHLSLSLLINSIPKYWQGKFALSAA